MAKPEAFERGSIGVDLLFASCSAQQMQEGCFSLFLGLYSTSSPAETTAIKADMTQIFANPLIIDRIDISNISIGVEYYKDGSTNWDYILKTQAPNKQGRDYLIRTLVLKNLTVEVTSADGEKKRYPTLKKMEFHSISSASGFPIADIEKAIFKLVMQDIFKQFDLLQKLPINSPIKYLLNLFK